MMRRLFDLLFGCAHKRLSRPVTPASQPGGAHDTYVVCLDCGKRLAYDMKTMTLGRPLDG